MKSQAVLLASLSILFVSDSAQADEWGYGPGSPFRSRCSGKIAAEVYVGAPYSDSTHPCLQDITFTGQDFPTPGLVVPQRCVDKPDKYIWFCSASPFMIYPRDPSNNVKPRADCVPVEHNLTGSNGVPQSTNACVVTTGPQAMSVWDDGPSTPKSVLPEAYARRFWSAGVRHDWCYHNGSWTAGMFGTKSKSQCDDQIWSDMMDACPWWDAFCYVQAQAWWLALTATPSVGTAAYTSNVIAPKNKDPNYLYPCKENENCNPNWSCPDGPLNGCHNGYMAENGDWVSGGVSITPLWTSPLVPDPDPAATDAMERAYSTAIVATML